MRQVKKVFFIFLSALPILFLGCVTLNHSELSKSKRSPSSIQPVFDAHLHTIGMSLEAKMPLLLEDIRKTFDFYENKQDLQGGIVLSPTFNLNLELPFSDLMLLNEEMSKQLKKSQKLIGLCGVDIHREQAVALAKACLELEGFSGIKLRNFSLDPEDYGGDRSRLDRFIEILKLVEARHGIVLAHFSGPVGESEIDRGRNGSAEKAKYFYEILSKFKNVKFIVAHSGMYSFIGLNGIRELARLNNKRHAQIYLEISSSFDMAEARNDQGFQNKLISAWKDYGVDRILYGSDYPYPGNELEVILQTPMLSENDKQKIFLMNGLALMREASGHL